MRLPAFLTAIAAPPRDYPITLVPIGKVAITDGFWRQRLDCYFNQGIGHALDQCRKTGRLDNFEIAAGLKQGEHRGEFFNDSDVYKILEGMAYSTAGPMKPEHRKFLDEFIRVLGKARRCAKQDRPRSQQHLPRPARGHDRHLSHLARAQP